jgi:phospholipid/cholesterol/gamma-HCH transport system permease protein
MSSTTTPSQSIQPARAPISRQLAGWYSRSGLYGALQAGAMVLGWTKQCARLAVTPPYTWVPDAFAETANVFRRTMVPLAVTSVVYVTSYGIIMAGQFLISLGVGDRYGGAVITGYVRELATWMSMMVVAGVAASAVTADLGARKIREELDAMKVLGVDTVRVLVLPRVMGITFASLIVPFVALFFAGIVLNFTLVPSRFGTGAPIVLDGMKHSITAIDIYALLLKHLVMGIFIGLVACERGMTCRTGADGVGRAVNQCVVITFFGIWLINSFWNTAYLSFFPEATGIRG